MTVDFEVVEELGESQKLGPVSSRIFIITGFLVVHLLQKYHSRQVSMQTITNAEKAKDYIKFLSDKNTFFLIQHDFYSYGNEEC